MTTAFQILILAPFAVIFWALAVGIAVYVWRSIRGLE